MLTLLTTILARTRSEEDGQAMVEYGLILVLISIAALVVLPTVGLDVQGAFQQVEDALGGN